MMRDERSYASKENLNRAFSYQSIALYLDYGSSSLSSTDRNRVRFFARVMDDFDKIVE